MAASTALSLSASAGRICREDCVGPLCNKNCVHRDRDITVGRGVRDRDVTIEERRRVREPGVEIRSLVRASTLRSSGDASNGDVSRVT